jgi:hypothetical protein
MFRSSLVLMVAALVSQPLTAEAGDFRPGKPHVVVGHAVVPHFAVPHVAVPHIGLPHFNLPGKFVPHVPVPHFPQTPNFGKLGFKHLETYRKWEANRRLLGSPVGQETSIFSSRTNGSWMRFQNGYVVRNGSGRTFIVRGGIGQAWIEQGGAYGRLGLPRGNEFEFNDNGHDAQVFERGMIHWNASLGRFVVGPVKSKI